MWDGGGRRPARRTMTQGRRRGYLCGGGNKTLGNTVGRSFNKFLPTPRTSTSIAFQSATPGDGQRGEASCGFFGIY